MHKEDNLQGVSLFLHCQKEHNPPIRKGITGVVLALGSYGQPTTPVMQDSTTIADNVGSHGILDL